MPEQGKSARSHKPGRRHAICNAGGGLAVMLGVLHPVAGAAQSGDLSVGPISTYQTPGAPFEAVPLASGGVLVSLDGGTGVSGIGVYTGPAANALTQKCLVAPTTAPTGISPAQTALYNLGANLAVATESPGVALYSTAALLACQNPAVIINQVVAQFPGVSPGTNSVVIAPYGRYGFIANEDALATTITSQGQSFVAEGSVGVVPLEQQPIRLLCLIG